MKKTIIIYASNYGYTKQYARYLAQKLACEACEINNFNINLLQNYETIIFGAGVYAGNINQASFINNNQTLLKDKNIVVFSVSLTKPKNAEDKKRIHQVFIDSFNIDLNIKFFNFLGGITYSKLKPVHANMMQMAQIAVKSKLSPQEYKEYLQDKNLVDFTKANELVNYVKNL